MFVPSFFYFEKIIRPGFASNCFLTVRFFKKSNVYLQHLHVTVIFVQQFYIIYYVPSLTFASTRPSDQFMLSGRLCRREQHNFATRQVPSSDEETEVKLNKC